MMKTTCPLNPICDKNIGCWHDENNNRMPPWGTANAHFKKEAELREAFKIFDRDKDGYISMKELKKVTSMLGTVLTKEEIEEFMAEADVDGNGKLDYDEFVKMLQY